MTQRGVALLAVLWTVTMLGGVVAAGIVAAGWGQRATANRVAMVRGRWAAEACLAIAERRAIGGGFGDTGTLDLGRTVTCSWTVQRPDARLDANSATRPALVILAKGLGVPTDAAERFADYLVILRRRAPLLDVREIEHLPGAQGMLASLTVDGSGRVDAHRAPAVVLAALPGLTPEAVDLIVRRRESGFPISGVEDLAGALSPSGRAALVDGYADLAPLLVFGSGRLVLVAEGWVGGAGQYPKATIELVVQRLPDRLAVLRRRVL